YLVIYILSSEKEAVNEDEEPFEDEEDDDKEEEHLAPVDSSVVPIVDPIPPAGDAEAFETDESAPTPGSPQNIIPIFLDTLTNTGAPLSNKATEIRLRALLLSTSRRTDIPEADVPPWKRACLTTPTPRLKVEESSAAGAARQSGPTESDLRRCRVEQTGYRITDTHDEIVDTLMAIASTTLEGVNQRVTELDTNVRDRPDHHRTTMLLDREAIYAHEAWAGFEERSAAIVAHVRTIGAEVAALIAHTSSHQARLTTSLRRIEILEARDPMPQEGPAKAGSSSSSKAREDDERHQESRQDRPDQIMLQQTLILLRPILGVLQIGIMSQGYREPVMSDASSAVTYTSVYTDSEPWRYYGEDSAEARPLRVIIYGYDGLPIQPGAPPSPDYVLGPEHPPSPDYVPDLEHPPSPVEIPYVPEPEYPEYLAPSNDEAPLEDQPLPADASPIAASPDYVADSNPEEDPEEDPEDDQADYPADGGGDGDDEPFDDDDDDDTDDEDPKEEPFKEDDEEEEHLAQPYSSAVPIVDHVLLAGETEALEADEPTHAPGSPISIPLSQTRLRAPLGYRAAKIKMRALLPSTFHRTDIPETDMPPRKRACLTTPALRFEIREIFTAGAARQPRPTEFDLRRCRVEQAGYEITDTDRPEHRRTTMFMDREAMYSHESWAFSMDGSSAIAAHVRTLETQIAALITQTTSLQTQLTTTLERIEKIAPKKRTTRATPATATTPTITITNAQLHALIDRGVAAVLAERDANRSRNGDNINGSGTGGRREMTILREFSYTDFLKCQPMSFQGIEGVISLTRCGKGRKEAIEFATEMMDKKMLTHAERQGEQKRKLDDTSRNNQHQQQPFKRNNVARAYTTGPGDKKPYGGIKPLCPKCNYYHDGPCTQKAQGANARGITCFKCGVQGHYKSEFPKLKNGNQGNRAGNRNIVARAYAVGTVRTKLNSNAVMGTFLLNNRYASVLFDTGVDKSFVSIAFSLLIDIIPTTLDHGYDVKLADGRIIWVNTLIRGCTLNFLNHHFNIDLMPVEMGSFDIIIGMDWLVKYHAVIVCNEKLVRVPFGDKFLIFHGDESNNGHESRKHK
nr:hypothetical protein [Tanacetum cinerariifolium]